MIQRKPAAALLALVMLFTTLFAGIPSAFAAGQQTTEDAYVSELQITNSPKGSYIKGDEITLEVAVKKQAGGAFGVRLFDTAVSFDTTVFTLKEVSASAAAGEKLSVQRDYKPSGSQQTIKLMYSNPGAKSADFADRAAMATITLKVNRSVVTGETKISQAVSGMSDAAGSRVKNLTAESVTVQLSDGLSGYRFDLSIPAGEQPGYQPGDSILLSSVLSSPNVDTVSGASVTIAYDRNLFDAAEGVSEPGVTQVLKPGEITLLYVAPDGAEAAKELTLGTFKLTVKEDAESGATTLRQLDTVINKEETIKDGITADSLTLAITKAGSCSFDLVPQSSQATYGAGDLLKLDVVVTADQAVEPRMIAEELTFNEEIFTFVSASAIEPYAVVHGQSGKVKWAYSDTSAAGTVPASQRLVLGSLTLEVAEGAAEGPAYLNQSNSNLVIKKGNDIVKYGQVTAKSLMVSIAKPFYALTLQTDETMGRITVGASGDYAPNAVITLKAEPNSGFRFVRWESSGGGRFQNASEASTLFTMPAAATTVTAVFAEKTDPEVTPATASYDRYLSSGALTFTLDPKKASFLGIQGMTEETDYTVEGNTVTLPEATLKSMSAGNVTLSFLFSGEKTVTVLLVISDSSPEGVAVTGTVSSYNPGNTTTLQLLQGETVVYTTAIEAEEGSGSTEQAFRFEGVAEGTYTLRATKPAHTSYTVKNVTVGTEDLDLTADPREGAALLRMLAGDINGDGTIGAGDVNLILNVANNGKAPGTEGVNDLTDLNGDGTIGAGDVNIILNVANNGKGSVTIE